MLRFPVIVIALVVLSCLSVRAAQSKNSRDDTDAIRVGVAVLRNTATRSVPVTIERDRLINAINRIQVPKHSKGARKIRAVALDSSSLEEANTQAHQLGCDYVVITDLVELRESGDPAPTARPSEIRIGRDPVANDPTVGERHEVQRYAVVDFRLYRLGDPQARVESSASDHQATTDDGIVSMLMDRVASRVVGEIRNTNAPTKE